MNYIFATFVLIFLFSKRKSTDFDTIFVGLALFFSYVFYIYPLSVISSNSGFQVTNWTSVSDGQIFASYVAFILFGLGFFLADKAKKIIPKKKIGSHPINDGGEVKLRRLFFYSFALIVACYFIVNFFDAERAARGFASRRGDIEGSHLKFFFKILLSGAQYAILLVLIQLRRRNFFIFVWLFFLAYSLTGATGRMHLLELVAFGVVALLFDRPVKFIFVGLLVFFLITPLLINLKAIIYKIAYLHETPDLASYYLKNIGSDRVIKNFGHPVYSFIERDRLIDLVGYRYFYDVIHGAIFYLRIFGVNVSDSLIYFNTESILGVRQSVIPTGYLLFGYAQIGYFGVFLSGAAYRLVGLFAKKALSFSKLNSVGADYYFALSAAYTFYHGEMRVMIMTFFVPTLLTALFCRFSLNRNAASR